MLRRGRRFKSSGQFSWASHTPHHHPDPALRRRRRILRLPHLWRSRTRRRAGPGRGDPADPLAGRRAGAVPCPHLKLLLAARPQAAARAGAAAARQVVSRETQDRADRAHNNSQSRRNNSKADRNKIKAQHNENKAGHNKNKTPFLRQIWHFSSTYRQILPPVALENISQRCAFRSVSLPRRASMLGLARRRSREFPVNRTIVADISGKRKTDIAAGSAGASRSPARESASWPGSSRPSM